MIFKNYTIFKLYYADNTFEFFHIHDEIIDYMQTIRKIIGNDTCNKNRIYELYNINPIIFKIIIEIIKYDIEYNREKLKTRNFLLNNIDPYFSKYIINYQEFHNEIISKNIKIQYLNSFCSIIKNDTLTAIDMLGIHQLLDLGYNDVNQWEYLFFKNLDDLNILIDAINIGKKLEIYSFYQNGSRYIAADMLQNFSQKI